MPLAYDELSKNAMGGTELLKHGLVERMERRDPDLLNDFQIFVSRVHEPLDKSKIILYWHHDLPNDPECSKHLKNQGWENFDLLIFNSNWQMQQFNQVLGVPFSKSIVLENCIVPLDDCEKDYSDTIRLIYTPTPHRGLELLVPVFEVLQQKHPNIELDVFSSFNIYGWGDRDKQYEQLFEKCRNHPKINYHGFKPNSEVRKALLKAHIFAYPSIWIESSCMTLMEAMSAKLVCVHPNYGALIETSGGLTSMYQWTEDANQHAQRFHDFLDTTIESLKNSDNLPGLQNQLHLQKVYCDTRYNWNSRENQWFSLLSTLKQNKENVFSIRKPAGNYFRVQT
jgi:UDP-glucose:(glucosyl)LPS alpha-1,2-glucosyltransferase